MGAVKPTIQKDAKLVCVGTSRPPSDFNVEMECTADVDDQGINLPTKENWKQVHRGIYKYRSRSGISAHGIHYSADPHKDPENEQGEAWQHAMSSVYDGAMESTAWLQHMEIDFAAVGGTLLIPFLRSHKNYLTIKPIPREKQFGWRYYAGFDYGKRNLTVFGVYAVTPDDHRYIVFEIAKSGAMQGGVPGICKAIMDCEYWDDVKGAIRADPSIWNESQAKMKGGYTSIAQMMREEGVTLSQAPIKGQEADIVAAERLLSHYWANPMQPTMQIFQNCHEHLRQWQKLKYKEWGALATADRAPQEELVDKENDTWDAWKYAECARTGPKRIESHAPAGSFSALRKRAINAIKTRPGKARAPVASPSHLGIR